MEDIEEMTDLEIVENFINLQKTEFFAEEKEVQEAYDDFIKVADYHEIYSGTLVAKWTITSCNNSFPAFDVYLGANNAECIAFYNQYMEFEEHGSFIYSQQCLFCSSESLEKIIEEVQEQYEVVSEEGVARYFLANPRKDVVEWALKHKDELKLNNVDHEFIEKHQAIPELKELILKELGKKGE